MADLSIDASDLQAWASRIAGAPAILGQEQLTAMQRATLTVQAGAQSVVRVDKGELRQSVTTVATADEGKVGTNKIQGVVMDKGRRAGAPMPPQGALLGWMARHGIPEEMEFVVRRAIARKGITGDKWLTGTFERLKPEIIAEFRAIFPRLIARMKGA